MTAHDDTSGIDWDQLMATTAGALWPLPDVDTIPGEPEIPMPAELEEIAAVHDAQIETVFRMLGIPFNSGIVASACRAVWAQISAAVMAHRREYIAASGAHTELDYYRQETAAMPIAPPRHEQWFRIWSPDYRRTIWEVRISGTSSDGLDAAKRFMAGSGLDDAVMTVDWGTDWKQRWSGRIFRPGPESEYQIHDANEYLRYLAAWPNPAIPQILRPPTVAVIARTQDRAQEIADILGIDRPWVFGAKDGHAFEGLRADRVLIDADSDTAIDPRFLQTAHATALKTPGGRIHFVTVRDFR